MEADELVKRLGELGGCLIVVLEQVMNDLILPSIEPFLGWLDDLPALFREDRTQPQWPEYRLLRPQVLVHNTRHYFRRAFPG